MEKDRIGLHRKSLTIVLERNVQSGAILNCGIYTRSEPREKIMR